MNWPAVAATWLTLMVGLLIGGGIVDLASFLVAAAGGAALVVLGFAAASRRRMLSQTSRRQRARLAILALVIGAALGVANLAANWAIGAADPTLRVLLVERMAMLRPLDGIVASPILEEVVIRLFLMSAIAWVVSRFTNRAAVAFAIALVASSLFFALLHLARPLPEDLPLANFYRAALLIKYTLAGLPLGWIFWRWGLPYVIVCHAVANATHLALQGVVF